MKRRLSAVCVLVSAFALAPACGGTMCEEHKAPVEKTHAPYVVDGGSACRPTDKRQNVSYPMSVAELESKYTAKFAKLIKIDCNLKPLAMGGDHCFRDGTKIVTLQFYRGDEATTATPAVMLSSASRSAKWRWNRSWVVVRTPWLPWAAKTANSSRSCQP